MTYECQHFFDGQLLTAQCLNHMEEGIKGACDAVPPACDSADYSKVLSYGENGLEWVDMPGGGSGGTGGAAPARISSVTLRSSAWAGSDSLYSQVVTIDGITEYSKVDLLPSVEQLAIFHDKDVAFVTENEDGIVTVFAIGDKPTQDYTMQISITEVTA